MANITFSEASGVNDSVFGKSQAPIRMFVEKRAEEFEQQSIISKIFDMQKSNHALEKIGGLTAMEDWQPVGENGAHPVNGMQEGFSKIFEHMVWKSRFSISREMVDDAKMMDFRKRPDNFVTAYYRTRENFGAALLAGAVGGAQTVKIGGKTFDITTADGMPLFSTGHKAALTKTTTSNLFADSLSYDSLNYAETKMQNFGGDRDELLSVAPDTILIPNDPEMKDAALVAVGSDKDPSTGNNKWNWQYGRWNIIIWPYLNRFLASGVKPWILIDSDYNRRYGGAVWLDRTDLDINSYIDNDTNANVWDGYARWSAGFADYRAFAVGGITGGTTLISSASSGG